VVSGLGVNETPTQLIGVTQGQVSGSVVSGLNRLRLDPQS